MEEAGNWAGRENAWIEVNALFSYGKVVPNSGIARG